MEISSAVSVHLLKCNEIKCPNIVTLEVL
jgi:hypothetical protein